VMSASTVGLYCAMLNWGAWHRGNPSRPHHLRGSSRVLDGARHGQPVPPIAAIVLMITGEDQQAALHAFQVGTAASRKVAIVLTSGAAMSTITRELRRTPMNETATETATSIIGLLRTCSAIQYERCGDA
jgi:hypothetical protein